MKVFIGSNSPETHIVQQLLSAEGVRCEVRGEGVFGLRGEVPFDEETLPYVWLLDLEQKILAKAIILEWQQQSNRQGLHPEWTCPVCNELNEAQFGACWNCQTPAPPKELLT
ncbi:DUF2007 domain-containing protein [Vibrio mediterranei]|uniref:DUF2007 domain-containing protein n=1 Tax=Vibrio mediterranei TaxID=689 RepID=UPI004067AD0E